MRGTKAKKLRRCFRPEPLGERKYRISNKSGKTGCPGTIISTGARRAYQVAKCDINSQ